jgi:RNA polymerase sigma-70 factor (ECF subfamily)
MYIRRKGYDRHAAEDLTQGFFAHLLDSGVMTRVDRSKGRFRSFMIGTLKNFLLNENDRNNALKRGGGMQIIPLDETLAESIYQDSPADSVTPEKQFDRDWALGVMRAALERLKSEYSTVKKRDLFCVLETGLTGETETGWLHQASSRLGMTEATVRVALHRLRRRYGDLLRDEISQTVLDEADIDDEIRLMFSALG